MLESGRKIIIKKPKPQKNNHTFYIDDDVHEKLQHIADDNEVSISVALNEVLHQFFEAVEKDAHN